MRGELLFRALKIIQDVALSGEDFIFAVLSEGYGASVSQLERAVEKRARNRAKNHISAEIRHRYANLIYKLKKENLVLEKSENGKKVFKLTGNGESKLNKLSRRMPRKDYSFEDSANFTIVAFDVPEKERRKRRWLRETLSNLGLRMLQRSVWLGKVKLPEEFLNDLKNLKLLNYVEIFEITKTGSLKQL